MEGNFLSRYENKITEWEKLIQDDPSNKETYQDAQEIFHPKRKTFPARQEISHCEKRPFLDARRISLADKEVHPGFRMTDAPRSPMISQTNHCHGKPKNVGRKRKAAIGQHGPGRKYTNGTPGITNYFHTNN